MVDAATLAISISVPLSLFPITPDLEILNRSTYNFRIFYNFRTEGNLINSFINDNSIKETYKKLKVALQKQHNMKINISPKVDSKTQRRVQCSIPKVDTILGLFPNNIISRSSEPIIRNVKITGIITSGPRQRNSKAAQIL